MSEFRRDHLDFICNRNSSMPFSVVSNNSNLALPNLTIVGEFVDYKHYLDAVDLLISASFETQHRNQIIETQLIHGFKSFANMLDIGIGNGDLTKYLGQYYYHITVIDTSSESFKNIPDYHLSTNFHNNMRGKTKVKKIHGSIVDLDISSKQYDLILFSHILYYIQPDLRPALIDKLYNGLSKDGVLLIIFNEGLSRFDLTNHFGGKNFEFSNVVDNIYQKYDFVKMISSKETIKTDNIEDMIQIAGVCLKDANTTASIEDVEHYLNINNFHAGFYHIDMIQQIIVVGELGDY